MPSRKVLQMQLRAAVADLEFIAMAAQNDLNKHGEFQCDYHAWRSGVQLLIDDLVKKIEKEADDE